MTSSLSSGSFQGSLSIVTRLPRGDIEKLKPAIITMPTYFTVYISNHVLKGVKMMAREIVLITFAD